MGDPGGGHWGRPEETPWGTGLREVAVQQQALEPRAGRGASGESSARQTPETARPLQTAAGQQGVSFLLVRVAGVWPPVCEEHSEAGRNSARPACAQLPPGGWRGSCHLLNFQGTVKTRTRVRSSGL